MKIPNISIPKPFAFVTAFLACSAFLHAANAKDPMPQAKTNALLGPSLRIVPQKGETFAKGVCSYDFGSASVMDLVQYNEDSKRREAFLPFIPGLKHDFLLRNDGLAPVTIVLISDSYI